MEGLANIGPKGVKQRRLVGWIALAIVVASLLWAWGGPLPVVGVLWRSVLVFLAALSLLQAQQST